MTIEFSKGTVIHLVNGNSVAVLDKLGEGGQGTVYRVDMNGKEYALKWYFADKLNNAEAYYQNLNDNIQKGSPNNAFLWPEFLTEKEFGSFGYVMKLRPKNYHDFSEFLLNKVNFKSLSAVVQAAIYIVNGFRDLHRKGYSYQDLNDGNFFIDPNNGNVLICDNDNVAPYGSSLGVAGKARYMAPEVVRNIERPNNKTDRFSLAVILFLLFFNNHPLEGLRVVKAPCLTEELELKFYGTEPCFICDPNDKSNRPVAGIHDNVLRLWNLFPSFVHEKFIEIFSPECMQGTQMRPTDNDWQVLLTNLRSCIAVCPKCGEETFIFYDEHPCVNCGVSIPKQRILSCKDGKYKVILFPGNKLYRCHVDSDSDDFNEVAAEVIRNPKRPDIWGLKNLTNDTWNIVNKDRTTGKVEPNGVLIITRVIKIIFSSSCDAEILF